jgi:hypothetical protein
VSRDAQRAYVGDQPSVVELRRQEDFVPAFGQVGVALGRVPLPKPGLPGRHR